MFKIGALINRTPKTTSWARKLPTNELKLNPEQLNQKEINDIASILFNCNIFSTPKEMMDFLTCNKLSDLITENGTRILEERNKDGKLLRQILFFQNTSRPDCVRTFDEKGNLLTSDTLDDKLTKKVSTHIFLPYQDSSNLIGIRHRRGIENISTPLHIVQTQTP